MVSVQGMLSPMLAVLMEHCTDSAHPAAVLSLMPRTGIISHISVSTKNTAAVVLPQYHNIAGIPVLTQSLPYCCVLGGWQDMPALALARVLLQTKTKGCAYI